METNKVLSALSYFSIIFAAFIFPLVVFLVSQDQEVKRHAKTAFLSHLIPFIPVPIIIGGAFHFLTMNEGVGFPFLVIFGAICSVILSLIVMIWNIIKGIQVLR